MHLGDILSSFFKDLRSKYSAHLSKALTHLDKLGMESIVEKIIPTVDIPTETVEMLETDLTTATECNEDNEDIPECVAVQSLSVSVRESFRIIVCLVRGHLISSDKYLYFKLGETIINLNHQL